MLARYETAVEDTLWMQGMQRRIPLWAEHTLTSQCGVVLSVVINFYIQGFTY